MPSVHDHRYERFKRTAQLHLCFISACKRFAAAYGFPAASTYQQQQRTAVLVGAAMDVMHYAQGPARASAFVALGHVINERERIVAAARKQARRRTRGW